MAVRQSPLLVPLALLVLVWGQPPVDAVLPPSFRIEQTSDSFRLLLQDDLLLVDHGPGHAAVVLGTGTTTFKETTGNFIINDTITERLPLSSFSVSAESESAATVTLWSSTDAESTVTLRFSTSADSVLIGGGAARPERFDRLWLRLHAEPDETVFGGGEQYTFFNLRGRDYPVWTREQGILRDPDNPLTDIISLDGGAGGDYHTTYWPEASFLSSRGYYFRSVTHEYGALQFSSEERHELYTQSAGALDVRVAAGSPLQLVQWANTGRQLLPDWASEGVILGLEGGTEFMMQRYQQARDAGIKVAGIWIQDWSGIVNTAFGERVFWNWRWNETHYPGLDTVIQTLKADGVRLLAYINPYLNIDGDIYQNNKDMGYFLTDASGAEYVQDFGGFSCVTVDLLSEPASAWYEQLIRTNMLDLGISGWMADFAEYVPVDAVSAGAAALSSPAALHNTFPALWGRANRRAVTAAGKEDDTLFFVRSGNTEQAQHAAMTWSGDQNVDWTTTDGLVTTVVSALSLAIAGCGLNHFDIGGYTTQRPFFVRSEELLLRSAEYAVFTPVMRTHEGNRPDANVQWYSNERILAAFARLSRQFAALAPYTRAALAEYGESHTPLQRPTFLHYPNELSGYTNLTGYQYLYGRDLLVAPVYEEGAQSRRLRLPEDSWVHLWTGEQWQGPQEVTVDAPLGQPPVFYRADSEWVELFKQISQITE
ncbi:sulfoquinovosidase-like [Amphibalanus amphitrite]|uniref:sulfoquinovosidase-like n=1 Tax=Amphibalanus amphitrite TaxID=1232801 RepID=UPI001C928B8C|nr:sulfoquinovosidase-like [Amphibalanus amphitrite]